MSTSSSDIHRNIRKRIVIDCAGAVEGGAARFLRELRKYLDEAQPFDVKLIGEGKQLTPQWLIKREFIAASADIRISLNNAGFVNPTGTNITLLRNILQFATDDDLRALEFVRSKRLRAQTPLVRALARVSALLVVPSTKMAEHVIKVSPSLTEKLIVRFHPVSQPEWAGAEPKNPYDVLLPIVPKPYKNLDQHIPEFLYASEGLFDGHVRLIVPTTPDALPHLARHPRVKFIGSQTSEDLEQWWKDCAAVFFPVEFEAFGYPLAESRVYGRHVVAQATSQNFEIAGGALKPYERYHESSLRKAIREAVSSYPKPESTPFCPLGYFEWLLNQR